MKIEKNGESQSTEPLPSLKVTQSRILSYQNCPRKEYYQFRAGKCGVRPPVTPIYFLEGEFGHYALMHWYRSGRMLRQNMIKRIEAKLNEMTLEPAEYDEYRQKMAAMIGAAHGYKVHYAGDLKRYKIVGVEQKFSVKLGDHTIEGKIDLAVEDQKNGGSGFFEHKFVSQFSSKTFQAIPLRLQGLIYALGYKSLYKKLPDWYQYNFIRKSAYARKGPTKTNPTYIEPFDHFEARVTDQYINEPDRMFFRPPPQIVEPVVLKNIEDQVLIWIRQMQLSKGDVLNLSSCEGMYGTLCEYGPACTAFLQGHGDGWDAPECRGLYIRKEVLFPELEEEEEEEEVKK